MNRSSVVVGRATQVVKIQDDNFAAGCSRVPIRGEPAHAIVNRRTGRGVVNIDEIVGSERGVKSYSKQSAFAVRVDGESDKRRR